MQTHLLVPHPAAPGEVHLRLPSQIEKLRGAAAYSRVRHRVVARPSEALTIAHLILFFFAQKKMEHQPRADLSHSPGWSTLCCVVYFVDHGVLCFALRVYVGTPEQKEEGGGGGERVCSAELSRGVRSLRVRL
jgi:hypothetical protein